MLDIVKYPKHLEFTFLDSITWKSSRDVTFDEEASLKRSRKCQHEEVYEEETPPRNKETTCLPEDEAPEEHDMTKPQEPLMMEMS